MDTLSDAELAQRVSDLRNSDAGKSMLEKISTGSNEDFSAEELSVHNRVSVFLAEQDRRAVKSQFAAHLQSAGSFQQDSVHAKLDELLAANGPARRPLPGAKCDFKDKSGNDNNAAKRTWEFADLADKKFFEASQSVAKLSKVEVPDSIAEEVKASLAKAEETLAEGMKLCEDRALVAFMAFKDGWAVAKAFSDESITLNAEDEKRWVPDGPSQEMLNRGHLHT
eukprot:gene10561-12494_t